MTITFDDYAAKIAGLTTLQAQEAEILWGLFCNHATSFYNGEHSPYKGEFIREHELIRPQLKRKEYVRCLGGIYTWLVDNGISEKLAEKYSGYYDCITQDTGITDNAHTHILPFLLEF